MLKLDLLLASNAIFAKTAVWMYCHGLSFRTIAKFFNVNVRSVFNWVKAYAKANYVKPIPESDAVIIELDEMWHFIHSKKVKSGFGRLIAVIPINRRSLAGLPASSDLSTGSVESGIKLHFQSSTNG